LNAEASSRLCIWTFLIALFVLFGIGSNAIATDQQDTTLEASDGADLGPAIGSESQDQEPYPGCPPWNHTITFVNKGNKPVTIKVSSGCYNGSAPAINNTSSTKWFVKNAGGDYCWPTQEHSNKSIELITVDANKSKSITVASCWSGSFFVNRTKAEITFDGGINQFGKIKNTHDFYDASMVDGFSRDVVLIKPGPGGVGDCRYTGCNRIPECPGNLWDNASGACLSPCQNMTRMKLNVSDPEFRKYCCKCAGVGKDNTSCDCDPNHPTKIKPGALHNCTGEFGCSPFSEPGKSNPGSACCPWFKNDSASCNATSVDRAWDQWALDYIDAVKTACPGQYAWQYDDVDSTRTCQGGGDPPSYPMNYTVTIR